MGCQSANRKIVGIPIAMSDLVVVLRIPETGMIFDFSLES